METRIALGFATTDTDESFALEIRRGVCQFHETPPDGCDASLTFPRRFLSAWAAGGPSFEEGIESGEVSLAGERSVVAEFFSKFEPAGGGGDFALAVR